MLSAILLAAGESKRMGEPKLLLPLGGSSILERAIDSMLNSRVDEVVVVIGDNAEEMTKRIGNRPVKVTINPAYQQGMSTSIARGLSLVDDQAQAIILALADQPFIDSETVNTLIDTFLSHDKGIVYPVYQGKRGHPIVLSIEYAAELLSLKGDIGGREIIERHGNDILEVAVASEGINMDIDTPENYQDYINQTN